MWFYIFVKSSERAVREAQQHHQARKEHHEWAKGLRQRHRARKRLDRQARKAGFESYRDAEQKLDDARKQEIADRLEAQYCQEHFPPKRPETANSEMRYMKDNCPECNAQVVADVSDVVEVATALLAGGESTHDVAAYIAHETGIDQDEAVAILMSIKGKLAVRAQNEE